MDERRAIAELSAADFDLLVVCVAGWIPSHTVIDVITHWAHKPMVLWGLTGHVQNGRLVTTADQAGTAALRDPMEALGFKFKYVYDTYDAPYASADKVAGFARVAHAAARLKHAKIGFMGYRDMSLYGTLADGVSLRRVVGPDIEVFEMLEIVQRMEEVDPAAVAAIVAELRAEWEFVSPVPDATLEKGIRMHLAVMQKVQARGYEAISLVDVDGVKKLLHFPPALPLLLLADKGGVASIPENDALGSVTQLIVRYLTGQVAAYLEIYEFMADRLLLGVPDYVPSEVVEGRVRVSAVAGLRRAEGRHPERLAGQDRPHDDLPAGQPRGPLHHAHRHGRGCGAALLGGGGLGAARAASAQRRVHHRRSDRGVCAEGAEPALHHRVR